MLMVHKYITQIFINYYNIIIELLKLFYTFVLLLFEFHKNEYLILFLYFMPTVQIALNIN